MKTRIVVGMSGGVDSSVSALLLKSLASSLNLDIHGVFMHNWDTEGQMCPTAARDFKDALTTCNKLDIPLSTVDFTKEYWTRVFQPMLNSLAAGDTPNPDIGCNRWIKFGAFANLVLKKPNSPDAAVHHETMRNRIARGVSEKERSRSGLRSEMTAVSNTQSSKTPLSIAHLVGTADFIATGHYARIGWDPIVSKLVLQRAVDLKKDQTYFLSNVSQSVLQQTLFPLGNLRKTAVKGIARDTLLTHVSEKRESMGICFIEPKEKYGNFVGEFMQDTPGRFVTVAGDAKGTHDGLAKFTIGQKARISGETEKWFVASKNVKTGDIVVVPGHNHPLLYKGTINIRNWVWISGAEPPELATKSYMRASLKIRHQSEPFPIRFRKVDSLNAIYLAELDVPEKGVASGQQAVLYLNDICLGGGQIM
ncbi:hypothetical protein HDU98_008352 [Podochytrium sp. JEL0797]|nr:hypothetical protein HDU98_008352 [Podochytrium sp. JEL0797]